MGDQVEPIPKRGSVACKVDKDSIFRFRSSDFFERFWGFACPFGSFITGKPGERVEDVGFGRLAVKERDQRNAFEGPKALLVSLKFLAEFFRIRACIS